ncbi:hypothetical protein H6P81_002698 [Aristolochia fimbriata]|uniref:CCHC-type domain-containing protein n=1 Tax=Aristolochia fimbriata TaxID=158543 RepID=A0AAV7FAH3_ARIFI|nr:hypothetical protein H6P81_002698 [Aristolochia fimbriata]
MSLESGLGKLKHGFQSMLVLFVKRDTYPYEMDNRRSFENVGGTGEGAVMVYGRQAPAEGDERVEGPIVEFIPKESGEDVWPDPVAKEIEEEEEVEFPLPTMGVPPLEENDEPYPDSWIGVMDMDEIYTNTMVPGVDEDNVPPPVGVGVDQRAWRARNKALVVVFGGWEESYNLLPQFFKAIKDTNRATSFDGDNRLFPLAFVIVEKESIDTWIWFISCLARQVVRGRSPMCIISDRHIGIIRTVADIFPHPHRHRFCIRYIIANLKKRYNVKDLDKMVWRRERATQITTHLCPSVDAHLRTAVEGVRHLHVVPYGDGIFQAGEHKKYLGARRSSGTPPAEARKVGRPMSTRIRNSMDWRDDSGRYLCCNCKQPGHNKRACKTPSTDNAESSRAGLVIGNVVMANTPLLYDQDSHRSEAMWHGEDPRCLECTKHFQTLRHWPMDERMLPYIEAIERWRSKTNTFHLANDEMTITLEDVVVLLGERVDGFAMTGSTRGDWMELARVLLGVELPPAVGVGTSTYWTSNIPRGTGTAGWPFGFQVERPTDECHKPLWKPGAIQDRVEPLAELSGELGRIGRHTTVITSLGGRYERSLLLRAAGQTPQTCSQ